MTDLQAQKLNELLENASILITNFANIKDEIRDEKIVLELNERLEFLKQECLDFFETNTGVSKSALANELKESLATLNEQKQKMQDELNALKNALDADIFAVRFSGIGAPLEIKNAKENDVYLDKNTARLYVYKKYLDSFAWESKDYDFLPLDEKKLNPSPGEYGFGCAIRHKSAYFLNLTPLKDCTNPKSENFGNYMDKDENIFVCIPKMYYKINNNITIPELDYQPKIEISLTPKVGFSPFLCFKKSDGTYVNELFVAKYLTSNSLGIDKPGGKAISKKNAVPVSNATQNIISNLTYNAKTPENNNMGFFDAVKSAGENYCVAHAGIYFLFALVSMAQAQSVTLLGLTPQIKDVESKKIRDSLCAFLDISPFYPKGNYSNSSLTCVEDTSVRFISGGYGGKSKSGASSGFAKTTHNGQMCGVADVCGNLAQLGAGFVSNSNGHFVLKGIDLLPKLNRSNFNNENFFDKINLAGRLTNGFCGKDAFHIFSAKGVEDRNDYIADNLMQYLDSAKSPAGTAVYAYNKADNALPVNCLPFYGGYYSQGRSGVFCRNYWAVNEANVVFGVRMMLVPQI